MTPKRKQNGNTLSALKRKELSVTSSASKNAPVGGSGSVLRSGGLGQRKQDQEEEKVENVTAHNVITCNHQENNFHLSNKKAIFYNMKCYYEALGQNPFDNLPLTFHIKEGDSDKEFAKFMEAFTNPENNSVMEKYPCLGNSLWIVKPGENTNRGCGINVSRDLNQIRSIINNTMVYGRKRTYIIQKYLEKPLLYKNRKFDIRLYAMTTTMNGNLQGYYYTEGYLRTSCKEYNIKNANNRMIHLTNDAVQKKSEDYGKYENGNKVGLTLINSWLAGVIQ